MAMVSQQRIIIKKKIEIELKKYREKKIDFSCSMKIRKVQSKYMGGYGGQEDENIIFGM